MKERGVELSLCSTCPDYFGLRDQVQAGVGGGRPDISEALSAAERVSSL